MSILRPVYFYVSLLRVTATLNVRRINFFRPTEFDTASVTQQKKKPSEVRSPLSCRLEF